MVPAFASTAVVFGILYLTSSLLLPSALNGTANRQPHQSPPLAQISQPASKNGQDKWDRLVEERFRQDNPPAAIWATTKSAPPSVPKQTDYHDQNYVPRGVDNVVPLHPYPLPQEPTNPSEPQRTRITIVGENRSLKDRICWPYKEGSVERRNCKSWVGLNHRDRN